jgi:lipoprotein-releasing system permease protein
VLHLILINAGTLFICILMMIVPSFIITRITPVKAIRFN